MAEPHQAEALIAASNACHAAPHRPESHYAYGEAWMALGEAAHAEQAFAAAIQLAPAWAEAWISYGVARYRQGAIDDACSAMRQALLHAPGHQAAIANLGGLLRISGGHEESEALLRQGLEIDPANAGARLNLAADLLQEERPADALALLQAAPAMPTDSRMLRHWLLQSSLALLQLQRPAEATQELHALESLGPLPPELAPLWHWRQVLLALAENDLPRARQSAVAMADALGRMGPDAVPEHRIMAHYDLAKFWSTQGDAEAAFANWTAGHTLLKPTQPFSRAEHLAFIDATIAAFPVASIDARPAAGNNDPAPVFIVGMPRSGTTLCEQILAAHGLVHGAGERAALGDMFARIGSGRGADAARRIAGLDAETLDRAAAFYLEALHALAPDRSRVVDKLPGNYLYLGLAALMLPGAKFIHCARDPRDIGLSIFTFRFHGQHCYAHDLADLGWTIAQQERLMAHWKAVMPQRILTIHLSDWVTDFPATLARVLGHLDLPDDPACADFHKVDRRVRTVSRAQVRQGINARGLGRWHAYAAQLRPLIAELESAGVLPP